MKELLYAMPCGVEYDTAAWGLTPARMGWRIVPGPRLVGVGVTPEERGGALYAACGEDPGPGDPVPCCCQAVRECRRRGMDRILLDLEGPVAENARCLAAELGRLCEQNCIALYLPEALADAAPRSRVLISSLVTAGCLEGRLVQALERYGADRVVLAVEAGALDYSLPVRAPGVPMTAQRLRELTERLEPAVFFDRGLCAHYFTYMQTGGGAHLILFDTSRSVREKLDLAQRLGVTSALLAAPQVGPWLEEIFSIA